MKSYGFKIPCQLIPLLSSLAIDYGKYEVYICFVA